jgi:preprotein translocase subunit YajC
MGDWFIYVVLAGMIGLMFFNSRKRKRQLDELKSSIKVGASVVLHSGITGTVTAIDGDRLVIESTPGTKLKVLQGAVRGLDSWSSIKTSAAQVTVSKSAAKKPATTAVAKKTPAKSTQK